MSARGGPGTNQFQTKPRRDRGPLLSLVQPSADIGADRDPIGQIDYDPAVYTDSRRLAQTDAARASATLRDRAGSTSDVAGQALVYVNAASDRLWSDMHQLNADGVRTRDPYQIPSTVLPDAPTWPDPPSRLAAATRYVDEAVLDLSGPAADNPDVAGDQMMLAYSRLSHARQALRTLAEPESGGTR